MVIKGRIHGVWRNFERSLKFDQIRWWIEVRNWKIYYIKKNNSIANPRNQKSGDLDENSWSNKSSKLGENSYRKFD